MNAIPSYLLISALMAAPLAKGEGVADLLQNAEKGESAAQLALSEIYLKGEGVPKDLAEALKWLTKAAEQGSGEAQMKLGGIHLGGRGVKRSSSEAAKWYSMSADQGHAAAQCQLARMHMAGAGVPKDDVEAYKWADLASVQGDAAAKKVLAFLVTKLPPQKVAEAKQRAHDFLELKKVEKSLVLPVDFPELPDEPLPLLVPP